MLSHLILIRKLNHRNIELRHTTQGESVGVLQRNGDYRYVRWLGFILATDAAAVKGRPVKLRIARIGRDSGVSVIWEDVPPHSHVQGCLVGDGVYAVVDTSVRMTATCQVPVVQ